MTLRVLAGVTHRDRESLLLDALTQAFDSVSRSVDALCVVSTRRRVQTLTDAVVRRFDGRCWLPRVFTFEELFEHYACDIPGSPQYVSNEARLRLIADLLTQTRSLHRGRVPRGLARAIGEAVAWITAELVAGDASVGDLSSRIQPNSESVASGLAELVTRYRALVKRHALVDDHARAAELVESWKRHGFPEPARTLVLDGFDSLNSVQRAAVGALLPAFRETLVTMPVPDSDEDDLDSHRAFVGVRLMRERLERFAPETVAAKPIAPRRTPSRVARRLFQRDTEPMPESQAADGTFRVLRCANRRAEIRAVARLIRRELGGKPSDADFSRFAVVVPTWKPYQGLIDETFREYGLPTTMSHGVPLAEIPALRRVAKALNALSPRGGWTPDAIQDVFETATLESSREPAIAGRMTELRRRPAEESDYQSRVNLPRFLSYVREAGIGDAFDAVNWFDRASLYWEHAHEHEEIGSAALMDGEQRSRREKKEIQFAHDIAVVERRLGEFRALFDQRSSAAFADELRRLCVACGIVRQMFPPATPDDSSYREYSGWHAFVEALNQMREVFRLLVEVTGRPFDPADFAESLAQIVADAEHQCFPPQSDKGIRVLSTDNAVSETFERLFVVGLVEGEFPRARSENVYIAPSDSPPLNPSVVALDRLPTERFRFREMLMNADSAVITYPALESGKALTPSPFLEDVFDVCGASNADEIAPLSADERSRLLNAREVLTAMGARGNPDGSDALELPSGNVDVLMRSERLRSRRDQWSPFDGYLSPTPAARDVLEARCKQPYAVSALEAFARCPMRFFFGWVLKLRADEAFREDIAPNVRGQIVHEVLERYYRELNVDLSDRSLDRATANRRMAAVADETLRRYDALFPNLYWEEERLALTRGLNADDSDPGLLAAFLNHECAPSAYPVVGRFTRSLYSELRIGGEPRRDTTPTPSPTLTRERRDGSGDFAVSGRIDRVDVELETGRFVVFDYKTGANPLLNETIGGYGFQLPVYLLALRGFDGACADGVASAFYNLSRPSKVSSADAIYVQEEASADNKSRKGRMTREEFAAFMTRTEQRLSELDEHIRNGRFHWTIVSETTAGCPHCAYRDICRMNPSRRDGFAPTQPHYDPSATDETKPT